MHARQQVVGVVAILVLLTAGCVAVPSDVGEQEPNRLAPDSPDADDWTVTLHDREGDVGRSDSVPVDGELHVNATETYRRVELLLGADAPAPRVVVEPPAETDERRFPPSGPLRALGFTDETGDYRDCGTLGSASATDDTVRISPVDPATGERISEEEIELVLAHEYAHVVHQHQLAQRPAAERPSDEEIERRSPYVIAGIREGFAVALTESYAREYGVRWDGQRPMELRWCHYQASSDVYGLISGSYYFGGRYYLQRLDGTGDLAAGLESLPMTSEQLVHPETRGDEQPVPLSVDAAESRQWRTDEPSEIVGAPAGELAVRVWLRSALDDERVDAAATGWGNGTTVSYVAGDEEQRRQGAVWVLRWDSRADATEFEHAARDASGPIEDRGNTTLSIERVSPETVIVAGGSEQFVGELEATGDNGSITVRPPGDE